MPVDTIDKASNFIQNVGMGNFNFGQYGPVIMFWFKVFFWFALALLGGVMFWKLYLQYNVRVRLVIRKAGKVVEIKNDRAKIFIDEQGKKKLKLWKTRQGKEQLCCPPPEQKYTLKQGKFDYYDFSLDDDFRLVPNEIEVSEMLTVKAKPKDLDSWYRKELVRTEKKYTQKEKWKEFLLPAMFMGTIVICFLILFFLFKEIGSGLNDLAGSFAEVSRSCLR